MAASLALIKSNLHLIAAGLAAPSVFVAEAWVIPSSAPYWVSLIFIPAYIVGLALFVFAAERRAIGPGRSSGQLLVSSIAKFIIAAVVGWVLLAVVLFLMLLSGDLR